MNGHYTVAIDMLNVDGENLYRDLAGHPLLCTKSECSSSLRILRGAAPHFPVLRRLLCLLYEAVRHHKMLHSIDTALCVGDFETLCCLCCISDDKKLFSAGISRSGCNAALNVDQLIALQQPKLPDLESDLHVEHAELIADL